MKDFSSNDFEILKILWEEKELTGREIHERIKKNKEWAYTTTRTVLERMVKKEHLKKIKYHGLYLYAPNISKVKGYAIMISAFADKILESDHFSLIPLFIKKEILSDSEIQELKELLDSKDFNNDSICD